MGKLTVAIVVSLWVIPISILVNRIVPQPYMDEIFHVPQAQKYCGGDFFSWDPMITTPPGLYFISLAYAACIFTGFSFARIGCLFSEACSTTVLRSTNGLLAVLCSVLVYEIIIQLRPKISERRATLFAVILAVYPLHWFFIFLYYTDVASLTAVLAMYLACLKKHYYFSALLGAFSIFVRQTNVIWMLFVACTGVIDITLMQHGEIRKLNNFDASSRTPDELPANDPFKTSSNLRRRKPKNSMENSSKSVISNRVYPTANSSGLADEIQIILLTSWRMKGKLFFSFGPFFMVLVAFVAFVHWNGSVVLGAKEAHEVSPHFAQVMYFALVSALAAAPLHFSLGQAAHLFHSLRKNRPVSFCQWLLALIAGFLVVHFFSISHPYLLADNRHYTFYLWRKIVNAHQLMKYILVPLYVYSWFSIFTVLGKTRPRIWVFAYFLATAAALVPAPLIEFRYYTIPFYILILNAQAIDDISLALMALAYVVINIFTMMMFLFRPFHWTHEPGIQRFIW